jgi:hypothetical protein
MKLPTFKLDGTDEAIEQIINALENSMPPPDKPFNDGHGTYFKDRMGVGIRGLYNKELNKQYLQPSHVWVDGTRTKKQLPGTSACEVVNDWQAASYEDIADGLNQAANNVRNYGNANKYAIIIGVPQNGAEDIGEIVLSDAEVIGYIDF